MAKQSTFRGLGATLIKGAGEVYRSQNQPIGVDLSGVASSVAASVERAQAQKRAALDREETKAANYLGQMEAMDTGIVPIEYRDKVENSLKTLKNQYYETTMSLKGLKTDDQEYLNLSSKLNNINNSIKRISTTFADINKNKKTELEFITGKNYSEGNDPNTVGFINSVLTGSANMDIDASGNVYFDNNGQWTSYENMPNMIAYDGQAFGKVLTQLDNVKKYKRQLTDTDKTSLRSQMMNLLKSGGRDTAISLGSDDFIVPGGMGLGGSDAFDANPDEYRKKIVESYMGLFDKAANEGYQEYQQALSDRRNSDPKQWEQKLLGDATLYQNINEFANSGQISDINNVISVANRAVKGGTFRTGNELARILLKQDNGGSKEPSSAEIKKAMNDFGMNPNTLYLNDDYKKGYPIDTPANIKSTLLRLYGISPKRETEINTYTGGGPAAGDSIFQ